MTDDQPHLERWHRCATEGLQMIDYTAAVGDTVRVTVTTTREGKVYKNRNGVLCVEGWNLAVPVHEVEVLARAGDKTDV